MTGGTPQRRRPGALLGSPGEADADGRGPGLVQTQPAPLLYGWDDAVEPSGGELVTPHSVQRVVRGETTDELRASAGRSFGLTGDTRPAEGEEFLLDELTARDMVPSFSPVDSGAAAVVVDGARTPVTLFGGYLEAAAVFTLTPAGGTPLPATGAPVTVPFLSPVPVRVLGQWELPAHFTTGALDTRLTGTWSLDGRVPASPGEPAALLGVPVDLTP